MKTEALISQLQPEQYRALCLAVESGYWPDGRRLTHTQQTQVMQTILLYQAHHDSQEAFTVGLDGEVKRPVRHPVGDVITTQTQN